MKQRRHNLIIIGFFVLTVGCSWLFLLPSNPDIMHIVRQGFVPRYLSPPQQMLLAETMISELERSRREGIVRGDYMPIDFYLYLPNVASHIQQILVWTDTLDETTIRYLENSRQTASSMAKVSIVRVLFKHLPEEKKLHLAREILHDIDRWKGYANQWAILSALLLIEHGYFEREASRLLCEEILSFSDDLIIGSKAHFLDKLFDCINFVRPRSSALLYLMLSLKDIDMGHLMLKPLGYVCHVFKCSYPEIARKDTKKTLCEFYKEHKKGLLMNYRKLTFELMPSGTSHTKGPIFLKESETGDAGFIEDFEWMQNKLSKVSKYLFK